MKEWISQLQRQYEFVVYQYEVEPLGIWLDSNRGAFYLHELPAAFLAKAEFVKKVSASMEECGLVLPLVPDVEGNTIVTHGERHYYMSRWLRNEGDWLDYGQLGEALAQFHIYSTECEETRRYRGFSTWPGAWKKRVQQFGKYRDYLENRIQSEDTDDLDYFFLDNFEYLAQVGKMSVEYLHDCNYPLVCKESSTLGRLSYINFGPGQFTLNERGNLFFADPFAWIHDMRVRDIGQWIKTDVREHGWNPYHVSAFLSRYHTVSPLLPEEFTIMYAMFLLPGRFIKKAESIYRKPSLLTNNAELELFRDETCAMTSLTAYNELVRNEQLLREFPLLVEDMFHVVIPRMI